MPFVTKEHRDKPDMTIPGDICYTYYEELVDEWKAEPKWTNAHKLYLRMRLDTNTLPLAMDHTKLAAYELAWQVFFQLYVMPYEIKKREENGDI